MKRQDIAVRPRGINGLLFAALSTASLALGFTAGPAPAQEDEGASDRPADEEKQDDKYLALVGGDVFTGTGAVLRGATLLVKNGKIKEIGYDFYVPPQAKVIDVHGYRLYPGLVALSATSRITQGNLAPEDPDLFIDPTLPERGLTPGEEGNPDWVLEDWELSGEPLAEETKTDKHAGAKNSLDDFDPFSQFMTLALAAGITTVEQGDQAIKLRRFEIEDVVTGGNASTSMSWSGADSRRKMRDDFAKAAEYLRSYREWEALNDKKAPEPSKKGINSTAVRVLEGKVRAKFNAGARDDLLSLARFAQEFGFRPIIEGATEAWTVAPELGRAGATVVLTPRDRRNSDEQLNAEDGSSIENAAILHRAGVQIAVEASSGAIDLGGIAGRDLLALPIEADFAVRGGLPEDAALQAITIVPARILGVDHRIGSLEVGKDADILVTDGDILHYETFVQWAIVLGEIAYDKQEELYYAHIRPRPESPKAAEAETPAESESGSGEAPETPGETPLKKPAGSKG